MADSFPNALNSDMGMWYSDTTASDAFNDSGKSLIELSNFYYNSASMAQFQEWSSAKWYVGNPCGEGTLGEINNALQKLFIILKGVKKYADVYINGTINKIQKLKGQISKLVSTIASVLKSLVQRIRNWVLNKIRALLNDAITNLLPPLLKQIKDSLIAGIVDQLFCAFEDIIASLFNLVADFLYSLIGQIINAPLCAVEQFTNALINNLVNSIDSALGPIFDQINDILSGVASITGSVSSAIDFILGFQGFLCSQPECPELKEFQASLWGGPSPSMIEDFSKFGFADSFIDEVGQTAEGWLDDFFGEDSNSSQSPGSCYTGTFQCGIPQIVIFGGGGAGAVAQAIVNDIGQVIGANLLNGGSGYTSPPFVSIVDPANCGNNASAYSVLGNDDDSDSVVEIVINNPGSGYSDSYIGGSPVVNSFTGAPNPVVVGETVTLSWDVTNADTVSLGIDGYTSLPLIGSISLPITEDSVTFPSGSTSTTITYTITATKTNTDSESQTTTRNFILTVNQSGVSQAAQTNTSTPVINSFIPSPSTLSPGDIVTLSWDVSNATSVSLDVSGYSSLPSTGSASIVIPASTTFPTGGGNASQTFTLTATNSNAPSDSQTDTETATITIQKPELITTLDASQLDDGTGTETDAVTDAVSVDAGAGGGGGGGETETTAGGAVDTGIQGAAGGAAAGTQLGGTTGTVVGIVTAATGGAGAVDTGPGGQGDSNQASSGTGNNNAVSVISQIDVINTGIGYSEEDTVEIVGGNNGAELDIQVNPIGQIISINVTSSGYGFTRIPTIRINSKEGLGAQFRTRLKFIPLNKFLADQQLKTVDPAKLVQVIDCVTR